MFGLRAIAVAAILPAPLAAQEFITTSGPLPDTDFYRLVSCGAEPDGPCRKSVLHWPHGAQLRVSLATIDPAFLGGKQKRARAALVRALQHLNRSGANIGLEQVGADAPADIRIHLLDTDGTAPLDDTGIGGLDGQTVSGARVMVWARNKIIHRAEIVFSTRLHIRSYESAMLEELIQALGLLTDIRNPAYDGVSIFSQDSNTSKTLGPQDIMALQRHYPPE